jgi:cellulose biosynthesis protein BcsQ
MVSGNATLKANSLCQILSIGSGKGGVGKTSFAINIACELAHERKVLLIDCDLHNYGATMWLKKAFQETGKPLLNLADMLLTYDPSDQENDNIRKIFSDGYPLQIDVPIEQPTKGGQFSFIPAFVSLSAGQ